MFDEYREVLVLPKLFHDKVLRTTHESTGHLGHRNVILLVRRIFNWPLLTKDAIAHCKSCVVCQRCNKAGPRKAPMVERPVLTEPFQSVAVDLEDPLPKAKGGFRYVLTYICMASRWPDAMPLKNITAKAVAEALIFIFSRTALPYKLLIDQGSHKLMRELCETFGVEKIQTTAYHHSQTVSSSECMPPLRVCLQRLTREVWTGQYRFRTHCLH